MITDFCCRSQRPSPSILVKLMYEPASLSTLGDLFASPLATKKISLESLPSSDILAPHLQNDPGLFTWGVGSLSPMMVRGRENCRQMPVGLKRGDVQKCISYGKQ